MGGWWWMVVAGGGALFGGGWWLVHAECFVLLIVVTATPAVTPTTCCIPAVPNHTHNASLVPPLLTNTQDGTGAWSLHPGMCIFSRRAAAAPNPRKSILHAVAEEHPAG